jgi:uncharacterized protein
MADESATPEQTPEITSDDKLWGALSYIPLIAIVMLLIEDKKNRPFIKFNAIQAIALAVVLFVINLILGLIPVIQCFTPLLWLVMLWPAIIAFGGKYPELPIITDFLRKQGWV